MSAFVCARATSKNFYVNFQAFGKEKKKKRGPELTLSTRQCVSEETEHTGNPRVKINNRVLLFHIYEPTHLCNSKSKQQKS